MEQLHFERLYPEGKSTDYSAEEFVRELYNSAFPEDERRDFSLVSQTVKDTSLDFFLIRNEKQQLAGFISLWDFETFVYIEHFATCEAFRGQGIGAKVMQRLRNTITKPIIFEVELPDNPLAKRRIDFYKRCGFDVLPYPYTQPPYDKDKHSIPMLIMTQSDKPMNAKEFEKTIERLHKEVYGVQKEA